MSTTKIAELDALKKAKLPEILRSEAEMSSRPGQTETLTTVADQVEGMVSALSRLALIADRMHATAKEQEDQEIEDWANLITKTIQIHLS